VAIAAFNREPTANSHAGTPDDQVIMIAIAIAIGWPDENFPANALVSKRKGVDEAAVFVGF
jgi:hypothetical protein